MRFAFRACSANLRPASSRSSLLVCFLRAIACARHCFFSSRWFAASSQTLFSMTSACMFVVIPHVVPRDGCAQSEMLCVWQNEGVTILRSLRGMMRSDPNAIDVPRFIQAHGLHVPIILRPLTTDDCDEWNEVRWRNDDWLKLGNPGIRCMARRCRSTSGCVRCDATSETAPEWCSPSSIMGVSSARFR